MAPFRYSTLFFALFLFFSFGILKAEEPHFHDHTQKQAISFVQNKGQWEKAVHFRADFKGGSFHLMDGLLSWTYMDMEKIRWIDERLHEPDQGANMTKQEKMVDAHVYHMKFVGANSDCKVVGSDRRPEYFNYFRGSDQTKWAGEVPGFETVVYEELYAGIDLKVYSQEELFKYDFMVEAGSDPDQIRVKYTGAESLSLEGGKLKVSTSVNEVLEQRPYAFQVVDGRKQEVSCQFKLSGKTVSYVFPEGYDPELPLVIDPVLIAASYSGSSTSIYGHTATYDSAGNLYASGAGFAPGGRPATPGAFQTNYAGSRECVIVKYDPTGSTLLWASYLGGTQADYPHSLVVNDDHELWVLGSTFSTDFPVSTGAFQSSSGGTTDIFVTHFNQAGSALLGSTYLGGSGVDGQNQIGGNYGDTYRGEIIADSNGNCYVASMTRSSNFPTSTGAWMTSLNNVQSGVLAKLNSACSTLLYSTLIGGGTSSGRASCFGVVEHQNGEVYVTGAIDGGTLSGTTGAAFPTYPGGTQSCYIAMLNATGTAMTRATYFGTTSKDQSFFIEKDFLGNVYILAQSDGGVTATPGYYTGPNMSAFSGNFVAQFNSTLTTHNWTSVYNKNSPSAFLVDNCGHVYVSGHGGSGGANNFKISNPAIQSNWGGFYIMVLDPGGATFNYGTFYGNGSSHVDGGTSRFDKRGVVYQGTCSNGGFPTTATAYSQTGWGGYDIASFKIDFQLVSIQATATAAPSNAGCAPFLVNFANTSQGTNYAWDFGDGSAIDTAFQPSHTFTQAGNYNVKLIVTDSAACVTVDSIILPITVNDPQVTAAYTQSIDCNTRTLTLNSSSGAAVDYAWDMGDGNTYTSGPNITHVYANAGTYPVRLIVTDTLCGNEDTLVKNIRVKPINNAAIAAQNPLGCTPHIANFSNNSAATASANWNWDFGDGSAPSTAFSPNHTYLSQGQFNVTMILTDTAACNPVDSASTVVNVLGKPTATVSADVTICEGGSTQLNAGGGVSYQWTPAAGLSSAAVANPTASPQNQTTYTVVVTSPLGCTDSAQVTVDVHKYQANAGSAVSFCDGAGGAQLMGSQNGGNTASYYYTWWCDSTNTYCGLDSVHDDDPIANPTQTTTYYLQLIDLNGCPSSVDSTIVTVLPVPVANAGPDVYICPDSAPGEILQGSFSNAPGPFTVQWMPAIGLNGDSLLNPYARPDSTTLYTLIGTSVNGCQSVVSTVDSTSTVLVHVKPEPMADAGPDIDICLGQPEMVQGVGYNAGPNYKYEWSPALGLSNSNVANPMMGPPQTTIYTLTVWSNGCAGSDTMEARVHALPTASAGPQTDLCQGETVQLLGAGSGDPNSPTYTYQWTPSASLSNATASNPFASPDTTTTYYLTVTSIFACESPADSVKMVVKPTPIAEAGPNEIICDETDLQLNGTYSYQGTVPANNSQVYFNWSPATGLSNPAIPDPVVSPGTSTWYYFTVTHNTCSTRDSLLVTVNPNLNAWAEVDTARACAGDSLYFTGGGGLGNATYTWWPSQGIGQPSAANTSGAPDQSRTYYLIVEEKGCADSIPVPVNIIPRPDAGLAHSQATGCAPLTINLLDLSTHTLSLTWDFGDGSPVSNEDNPLHTYTQPGEYQVVLSASNIGACMDHDSSLTVRVTEPVAADFVTNPASPAALVLPNREVKFTPMSPGATEFTWEFGDGYTSSETNPMHAYTSVGEFYATLHVTDAQGCVSEVQKGPFIVRNPELMVPNVFTPNGDGAQDKFHIQYSGSQPVLLQVFDRWGVMHFETRNKTEGWDGMSGSDAFAGSPASEGVYYYKVKIGKQEFIGNVTLMR